MTSTYQQNWKARGDYRASTSRYREWDTKCSLIANNIKQINYNVAQLTKDVQMVGIPNKDSHDLRSSIQSAIKATQALASETNKALQALSQITGYEEPENRDQQKKLSTDLSMALERFREIGEDAIQKESRSAVPSSKKISPYGAPAPYFPEEDEFELQQRGSHQHEQKRQHLQQLQYEQDLTNSLLAEREAAIREIETSMLELNGIFVDLAKLIQEQAPLLDDIENHITKADIYTKKGTGELAQASKYAKSQRDVMCCFIVTLVIIVVVVTVLLTLGIVLGG